METIEGNKLIAEFMEMEVTSVNEIDVWVRTDIHNGLFEETNACFHFSWDWLHQAWEKFRNMKLEGDEFDVTYNHHLQGISSAITNLSAETAFNRLSRGIQWYNTTKPQPNATK